MRLEIKNYDSLVVEKYVAPAAVRLILKNRESANFADTVRAALRLALTNLPVTAAWGAVCGTRLGSSLAVKSGLVGAFVAEEVAATFKKYYSKKSDGTLQKAFFHDHPREHFPTAADCEKFGLARDDFLTAPSDGMLAHSPIDSAGFTRPLGVEMSLREIYKLDSENSEHQNFLEKMRDGKMLVFILKPRHKHSIAVPGKCAFEPKSEFAQRELDPARFWKLIRTTDPEGSKKMTAFCGKKFNPHLRNPRTVTELLLENFKLRSGARAKIYQTMLAAVGVRPIEFKKKMNAPQNFELGGRFAKFKIGSTVVLGIPRETAETIHFNEDLLPARLANSETMIDIFEGTIIGWNAAANKKLRSLPDGGELQISAGVCCRLRRDDDGFEFLRAKNQR